MEVNSAAFEGNLGRDGIKLNFTRNDKAFASGSIAQTPRRKDDDGEWYDDKDKTLWMDFIIWDSRIAENLAESCEAGQRIVVHGRLEANDWEDNDGNIRKKVQINADSVTPGLRFGTTEFSKKGGGGGGGNQPRRSTRRQEDEDEEQFD